MSELNQNQKTEMNKFIAEYSPEIVNYYIQNNQFQSFILDFFSRNNKYETLKEILKMTKAKVVYLEEQNEDYVIITLDTYRNYVNENGSVEKEKFLADACKIKLRKDSGTNDDRENCIYIKCEKMNAQYFFPVVNAGQMQNLKIKSCFQNELSIENLVLPKTIENFVARKMDDNYNRTFMLNQENVFY